MGAAPSTTPKPLPRLVLQYDRGPETSRLDPLRFVLLPLLLPGAVAVLLPFTWDVSPWEAVLDWGDALRELWDDRELDSAGTALLGTPFLLAWAAVLMRIRLLFRMPVRWAGGMTALAAACLGAICTLIICVPIVHEFGGHLDDLLLVAVAVAILLGGGALVVILRRRLGWAGSGIIAIHLAYLANAVLCLIAFWEDSLRSVAMGYRFTLFACAAALFDIAWTVFRSGSTELAEVRRAA